MTPQNDLSQTNELLWRILQEQTKVQLGFGHPPAPRYIYANRQYPNCLWYFWDHTKSEPEPIEYHALTGIITKIEVEQVEKRGKPTDKLRVHVQSDRRYVIESGIDTLFSKGLVFALSKIPYQSIAQPITIAVEAGDTDEVLFCRIYNPVTGNGVFAPWEENADWMQVTQKAIAKVNKAHGREEQEAA